MLSNLLSNALRYTPAPGLVELSVKPGGGAVEFSVCDSGVGIAAEELSHVFERFYRVDKSRSRALGGSGIGLTIAKALAEGMGGQMRAASADLVRVPPSRSHSRSPELQQRTGPNARHGLTES